MRKRVVFVANEILIKDITGYAGGLGILSGGLLSSARDIGYPLIGVTLVNKGGYVKHKIENGSIIDLEDPYEPQTYFKELKERFYIDLKGTRVYFKVWQDKLSEDVSIYFIDTDVKENEEWKRKLTYRLYVDESEDQKILRRLLLGLGTLEITEKLNIPVRKYHLNESHCAFLAIELFKRELNKDKVKKNVVFTTHTPLPHGHEKFSYDLIEKYYSIPQRIKDLSPEVLDTTYILFELSSYVNAVSWDHWRLLRRDYPNKRFDYITNGVHSKWVEEEMRELYDKYLKGWFLNPRKFINAGTIPLEELENARIGSKKALVNFINSNSYLNKPFEETKFLISIRRRITRYKMNDLPLKDIEKLESLAKRYSLQIFISGVTHPYDIEGKEMIKKMYDSMSVLNYTNLALFFKNGKFFERIGISGGDLLLHTSVPPLEACGTSWMRAALNGVPTLTTKTGGALEVIIDNYNGWMMGEHSYTPKWEFNLIEFYNKLEEILKLYTLDRSEFLMVCRNAIKTIPPLYNTTRALQEYIRRAYNKQQAINFELQP